MLAANARNKDPLVRAGAKGTVATDHSCCSVATEMVSSKKKKESKFSTLGNWGVITKKIFYLGQFLYIYIYNYMLCLIGFKEI